MPQRFGQAVDHSGTFAYLARNNDLEIRRRAQAVDQAREEELAAKDAEVFARYQAGKISGASILRYIRARINQTSYDVAQQRKWRATLVQYENAVKDQRAAAAFAKTGNIAEYLGHWQRRLRGTEKGTEIYTQIQEQIKALTDQKDANHLRKRGLALRNQIAKGKAGIKDLIQFYRAEMGGLRPDSPLRGHIKEQLATLNKQWREEKLSVGMQAIDQEFAAGRITPQEAGRRKQGLIDRMNIQVSHPALYAGFLEEVRRLKAMPDPKVMAQLTFDLADGRVSGDEYIRQMNKWADQIAPFNAVAAIELRTAALLDVQKLAPAALPNPGALGLRGGGSMGAVNAFNKYINANLKHIPQMDGSTFSAANCTMAAAAMLGYAMGKKGLTGADLRYKSRDREGGTTLLQAQFALEKSGVRGTRAKYHDRVEFDNFKNNLKKGAPAVLSGFNGSLTGKYGHLNASGIIGGHAIFVAKFHPKKGFLVFDPAKSKDKGTWWPAEALEAFGWGGVSGKFYRYGQALFAPKNTIPTRWNNRRSDGGIGTGGNAPAGRPPRGGGDLAGGDFKHIPVDAPAEDPDTPDSYVGQFATGPVDVEVIADAVSQHEARLELARTDPDLADRLNDAGISAEIDNVPEAEADLALRREGQLGAKTWIEEFGKKYDGSESTTVTVGSVTREFTVDEITRLSEELLYLMDGMEILWTSLGNYDRASQARQDKIDLVLDSQNIVTREFSYGLDIIVQQGLKEINATEFAPDPETSLDVLDQISSDLEAYFAANMSVEARGAEGPPEAPETDLDTEVEMQAEVADDVNVEAMAQGRAWLEINEVLNDPDPELRDLKRVSRVQEIIDMAGIEMPGERPHDWQTEGVPEDLPEGERRFGALIALATKAKTDWWEVQHGRSGYLLVPSGASSTLLVLPFKDEPVEPGQQKDADGQPMLDEQGNPVMEEELLDIDRELDLSLLPKEYQDMLTAASGLSSTTLPTAAVIVDGENVGVRMLAPEVNYKDFKFLRVVEVGEFNNWVPLGTDIPLGIQANEDNGLVLSQADVDELTKNGTNLEALETMVDQGVLEYVPYAVRTITMPLHLGPDGEPVDGSTYYQDPMTELWHEKALPFDQLIESEYGSLELVAGFVGKLVGGKTLKGSKDIDPESEWTSEIEGIAGNGVHAPHSPGITSEQLQEMLINMELGPPSQIIRRDDGTLGTYELTDEIFQAMYDFEGFTWKQAWKRGMEAQQELFDARRAEKTLETDLEGAAGLVPGAPNLLPEYLRDLRKQFNIPDASDVARDSQYQPQRPNLELPEIRALAPGDPVYGVTPADIRIQPAPIDRPTEWYKKEQEADTKDTTYKPSDPDPGPLKKVKGKGATLL